jgi:hypothetical protein
LSVLVAVHSLVAAQRLLDLVGLIESDHRIQVLYTQAPDVFGRDVSAYLTSIGALEIPWQQATRERFDLVLAAAYGGIAELHGPLMVFAHGAGFGKRLGVRGPVYGLDAQRLVRDGEVLPSTLVLSHDEQRGVLADQCPQALEVALVAGDPCFDRMLASRRLGADYRVALGVGSGKRLVVVASTWGRHSLIHQVPDVVPRVLRGVDADRTHIVVAVHPAAWASHGRRQMRAWLGAGSSCVTVLEPEQDWRPAILAADYVLGDHGSTSAYAAALGKPVLYVAPGNSHLDPGSAQAALMAGGYRWRRTVPLRYQLAHLDVHADPATRRVLAQAAAARLTSRPGQAHRLIRERMYELLGIPIQGKHRSARPIPVPSIAERGRRHA